MENQPQYPPYPVAPYGQSQQPHPPSQGINTAQVAAILNLLIGFLGVIIGYFLTRDKSDYEQRFGSLLMRAYIGIMIWLSILATILLAVGIFMAVGDADRYRAATADCTPVVDMAPASNITITRDGEPCELSDAGESEIYSMLSKYIGLAFIWFSMGMYVLYVSIRFLIAAFGNKLYRPVLTIGGRQYMRL